MGTAWPALHMSHLRWNCGFVDADGGLKSSPDHLWTLQLNCLVGSSLSQHWTITFLGAKC